MIETLSNDDSALCLKKQHYGRHRGSLIYGGFLRSKAATRDGRGEGHDAASEATTKVDDILERRLVFELCGPRFNLASIIKPCVILESGIFMGTDRTPIATSYNYITNPISKLLL